jgi:peptidoglycan/xylan/chitin deacetylase (PgdA/CDA1 family)
MRAAAALLAAASFLAAPGCVRGARPAPAPPLRIAVTLDDLPWQGATAPGETRMHATRRLLEVLRARGVPATGFVNCDRIEPGEPILEAWLAAGMDLGNHTSGHLDLNRTDLDAWVADVESCHAVLARLGPRAVHYFRYPMLHEGATEERRAAAAAAVRRLGYVRADVTVDNSEWILGGAYSRALKRGGDEAAQRALGERYVQHVAAAVAHFDGLSKEALGRSIPHVLLLHANALAADHLGAALDALRAQGATFVSLGDALADPAYAAPERYVGPKGLSWLYRIHPELLERAGRWDDEQADALQQQVDAEERGL